MADALGEGEITELVSILRDALVYKRGESCTEYSEQAKYEPCKTLSRLGNKLCAGMGG
ncbi:MAG: hypothetical protein LBU47_01945 [Christensenellaceae bacterium]|nr:hypothetical protein [Christensenellaceae bacterium]